jgi:hypothetical protein
MAQNKIHGFVATPDQFLSGGLPIFEVTTTTDLTTTVPGEPNGVTVPASGDFAAYQDKGHNVALDKLIQAISVRAQPVLMGTPAGGKFRFGVEHADIFGDIMQADGTTQNATNDTVVAVRAALGDANATIKPFAF